MFRNFFTEGFEEGNIFFIHSIRNLVGIAGSAEAHDIGNPVDQHGSLTAARTGKQKQWAFRGHHRFLLHIIQLRKLGSNIPFSGSQESFIPLFSHSHTCPS